MPLSTGCCGWCDTNLAGQATRGPYEKPLTGPETLDVPGRDYIQLIAIAA